MRHAVRGRKLGRTTAHREALFRNQLQSLVASERIITTLPKAKELRPIAEKVITRGKHGTVHDRRWVLRWVIKRDLVKKVFDEIAPRFVDRPGGYLRIVKLGPRQGDGAEMAVLELVERGEAAAPAEAPKESKPKKAAPKAKKEAKDSEEKPKKEAKKAASKAAKPAKPPKDKEKGRVKEASPRTERRGASRSKTGD
ncbi:MAG TPA: 50S ribosomal protein L17 [Thermoanaerobaculia bacterium]